MTGYLTEEQKSYISEYINIQPIKIVEKFDFKNKIIKYSDLLKGRDISSLSGDEEITRAFILTKLVNELGYNIEKIEIEHEYTAGRPHTNTSRIDIIVRDYNNNAFLFMELKSPHDYVTLNFNETIEEQLFKVSGMEKTEGNSIKYLILYTLDIIEKDIIDQCIVIDNEKYPTYSSWVETRNITDSIPKRYGKAQKIPFKKGSNKDLNKNFDNKTIEVLQKDLHNTLWGGGGADDNDIFSSLTNLILAKIQDEDNTVDDEIYKFQSLTFIKNNENYEFESNEELYNRINLLYKKALEEKMNITDKKQLEKSQVVDTNKFSLAKVKYTVQSLEKYSFVDGKNSLEGKDILGDFFEGIIRSGFKQTKGQFFTPINIVTFMIWAIQADKLAIDNINKNKEIPYLIDPSAGSGTFLIEYMKFITKNMKFRFRNQLNTNRAVSDKIESDWFYPNNRENKWAREYIYGSELNFNLGTATKVNMILHGDGSTNIFVGAQKGDGLLPFNEYIKESAPNALNKEFKDSFYKHNVNEQFDLILTNPPFSVSLDNDTKKKVNKTFLYGDTKNSENLFIERYYQLLKENGRFAAILPESVFDIGENKYIRLFLYKYFKIKAIISLPTLAFSPFTNTKTSIIFAQKKDKKEIKQFNDLWNKYSADYSKLKTRVKNLILIEKNNKEIPSLKSIKKMDYEERRDVLIKFLKNILVEEDSDLSNSQIINKYQKKLDELLKYDKGTVEEFGYVNTWWVFEAVAKQLNYNIFMAHADNVGYKRTKRGSIVLPNDLFRTDEKGEVLIDDGIKDTILDYMRELDWEGVN